MIDVFTWDGLMSVIRYICVFSYQLSEDVYKMNDVKIGSLAAAFPLSAPPAILLAGAMLPKVSPWLGPDPLGESIGNIPGSENGAKSAT